MTLTDKLKDTLPGHSSSSSSSEKRAEGAPNEQERLGTSSSVSDEQPLRYTGSQGGVGSTSFDPTNEGTGHGRGEPSFDSKNNSGSTAATLSNDQFDPSTTKTRATGPSSAVTGAGPDQQTSSTAADTQYDAELTAGRATGPSTVRGAEGFAGREQLQGNESGNDQYRQEGSRTNSSFQ